MEDLVPLRGELGVLQIKGVFYTDFEMISHHLKDFPLTQSFIQQSM